MSSIYPPHYPVNCIDDSISTFCHTMPDTEDPWLSILLPNSSQVSYVVIYNRRDCCQDRLSPMQLWVSNSSGDFSSPTAQSCGIDEVNLTTIATEGPFSFRCADSIGNPLTGDFLTLVLPLSLIHI